jgi:MFS family permease
VTILLVCEALSTLVFSPIAGYVADICPRRQIRFLFSLALMIAAILVIAFSNSIALFVLGRCIQGAATAVVTVAGFAMVLDAIPVEEVAVTLGWLSFANTAGFATGPALGGVLYRFGGWWAVFGTLLGMLGLDFMLRLMVIERRRLPAQGDSDIQVITQITLEITGEKGHGELEQQEEQNVKKDKKTFAMLTLLCQPRMVFMLLGVVTLGILLSSFDAVSSEDSHRRDPYRMLIHRQDASHLRPRVVRMERPRSRVNLHSHGATSCP